MQSGPDWRRTACGYHLQMILGVDPEPYGRDCRNEPTPCYTPKPLPSRKKARGSATPTPVLNYGGMAKQLTAWLREHEVGYREIRGDSHE